MKSGIVTRSERRLPGRTHVARPSIAGCITSRSRSSRELYRVSERTRPGGAMNYDFGSVNATSAVAVIDRLSGGSEWQAWSARPSLGGQRV